MLPKFLSDNIRYLESNMTAFFHLQKIQMLKSIASSWDFEVPMCITRQPWIPHALCSIF